MNVEDSEQIESRLLAMGLHAADRIEDAGVVLLNTCSVRKKPEDKAFSMLGVLRELKQERPHMVIGVCGCMAQLRADEIRRRAPHVDFVVGTGQISEVPALVMDAISNRRFSKRIELPPRKGSVVADLPARQPGRAPKLKAFVPIQYGCDKFCAFCIVPTTRGRERSRPTIEVVKEVAALAAAGTKEVTLLGQTVNSYGKNMLEGKVPFAKLLRMLSEIDGLARIRYTSPYPRDFRDDLIALHGSKGKVMEHVHLPLQSGDDEVLSRMRRLYSRASFTEIYTKLRSIPGMAVTTDVIVGFPGETGDQFERTVGMLEELRFDGAFMFAYSPRPGTPAADWLDQIPKAVKSTRLKRLIECQTRITCELNELETGTEFEVLVEGLSEKDPTLLKGLTRHGKTMHFAGKRSLAGELVGVKAVEPHAWGFFGSIVQ
jgi:tRNA-2-methylthio-N6-dimethylallyladenosine synthase